MLLTKYFSILFSFIVVFVSSCGESESTLSVSERFAQVLSESSNPADGTPSLDDLKAVGLKALIEEQEAYEASSESPRTSDELQKEYEMAIADASPALTSVSELSALISALNNRLQGKGYTWSDEFDKPGSPSSANWTYDLGKGDNGWGNNELQYYTNRPENVIVEDGMLKITAKRESYLTSDFTSTRMKTQGKFVFTYGRVEVRAKLPAGGGTWPAIWMLGANISDNGDVKGVGWPACGEIDIMEHTGNNPGRVSSALHNSASYGDTKFVKHTTIPTATSEFHIYSANWTKDKIEFAVDGNVYYTYNPSPKNAANWPYTADQFIILNIAMGGTLGGNVPASFTEASMYIDYVRVYQD